MKINPKTEKLVHSTNGLRVEGQETVGEGKNAHTYTWMRYIDHIADVAIEKKEEN